MTSKKINRHFNRLNKNIYLLDDSIIAIINMIRDYDDIDSVALNMETSLWGMWEAVQYLKLMADNTERISANDDTKRK